MPTGMCPRNFWTCWERKIFIAALFIKDCTSPKCLVNGEKEKYFCSHSYNEILYSRKMIEQWLQNFNVDLSYKSDIDGKSMSQKNNYSTQLPIYKGQKLSNFIIYK